MSTPGRSTGDLEGALCKTVCMVADMIAPLGGVGESNLVSYEHFFDIVIKSSYTYKACLNVITEKKICFIIYFLCCQWSRYSNF